VRYLLEKLQETLCNELKNEAEIAVIKTYGNKSKHFISIISCEKIFDYYIIKNEISYDNINKAIRFIKLVNMLLEYLLLEYKDLSIKNNRIKYQKNLTLNIDRICFYHVSFKIQYIFHYN